MRKQNRTEHSKMSKERCGSNNVGLPEREERERRREEQAAMFARERRIMLCYVMYVCMYVCMYGGEKRRRKSFCMLLYTVVYSKANPSIYHRPTNAN